MDAAPLSFPGLAAGTLARWRMVLGVAGGTVVFAVLLTLVLPPSFRATASFVTAESPSDLAGGLSDLAFAPGFAGLASQLGFSGSRDRSQSPAFYAQLLHSRELLTRLALSRFPDPRTSVVADSAELVDLLGLRSGDSARDLERAVRKLTRSLAPDADPRTNLVIVQVDARWPGLSAAIANEAVGLVSEFNREQRVSRARAKREFLETRVSSALTELRAAEDSQELFYSRNRLWENSPALVVEERRIRRQVETANSLYLSLRQQYESARIDEVNTTPVITVVDRAIPPRRREWPRRVPIVLGAAFIGLLLGLLVGAAREVGSHWARQNPDDASLLRGALRRVRAEVRDVTLRRARSATGGDGAGA
jgi:uncharacterized protein involved in exopolysaccharide biosynthesis